MKTEILVSFINFAVKVSVCVLDKLKNKIQNFILRFCFYLNIQTVIISNSNNIYLKNSNNWLIGVPEVTFRFFDKLKCEIRNRVLILVSILKLRHKLNGFQFTKYWTLKLLNIETKSWSSFVFRFNLKNEKPNLLKQISYETSHHLPLRNRNK